MKSVAIMTVALLFALNSKAQNVNVQETSKTTVTTVKNSDGNKKFTKNETVREVQNIELNDVKPHTLNTEMKESPVVSTSVTKITSPDGSSKTFEPDRSAYYLSNGNKYRIAPDGAGYAIKQGSKKLALLRKTSTNQYVYITRNKTSIGYFDTNGNLIIETYDGKSDTILTETYLITKN
ncbi:MAG TPA: hypothetical protein PK776_08420 [Flavobacterium sp.]|jgi:hypothetical protein|nr:hypothetical protein [Flavobacterium sp.]